VYNGAFQLVNAWVDTASGRDIFRFRLEVVDEGQPQAGSPSHDLEQTP
jgi:hypothetical protein